MRRTMLALMTLAAAVAAQASTATLAKAQFASVRKTARFLTLEKWDGRVDAMLASYGQSHAAPAAWKPGDPHWEQAKARIIGRLARRIDQLSSDPEAEQRMMKGFARMSDADADAAAAKVTPEIVDYSDLIIVSVATMEDKQLKSPTDPAVLAAQKRWGVAKPPADSPVHQAAMDPIIRRLMDARSSAVQYLSTGYDGQLQLLVFDRQDAMAKDIDAALADCVKAKHP